jgi:putative PIN family toxin of toxin-antitoxin system
MRVVIDTNVLVSRYMAPQGTPARIMAAWEKGAFELLVSAAILSEYRRVLSYPQVRRYHHLDDGRIRRIVRRIRRAAIVTAPDQPVDVVKDDPADNALLECAIAGNADAIVSGDRHLLALGEYAGIPIMTPAAFLLRLAQQEGEDGGETRPAT